MMIDTLNLTEGDVVGVLYCTNESNSLIQYEAVKALFEEEGIVVNAYTGSRWNVYIYITREKIKVLYYNGGD